MQYFKSKYFIPVSQAERKLMFISAFLPILFVIALGLILLVENVFQINLNSLGVEPRSLHGLSGILFMPLLHSGLNHWAGNAIPLILLGYGMIYFYRDVAYKMFFSIWLFDGIGVWLLGRPEIHIGASGLVYGLVAFLLFSGLLRKNKQLLAITFTVVVLYGSILYNMFPFEEAISWEGHLFGFITGLAGAVYFRKHGPKDDPLPDWMNDDNDEVNNQVEASTDKEEAKVIQINYHLKESDKQN